MTSPVLADRRPARPARTLLILRVFTAAGLGVSAYVHIHEAHIYDFGSTLTGTQLFYGQAVVAALVGLWLLVRGSAPAWVLAFLVGAASFGAVMLYRYVDVGALGPLPDMYDPLWYTLKTLSAVAEAAVAVLSVAALALVRLSGGYSTRRV